MSTPNYQRVKRILGDALEVQPERRAAFLERVCGDDPELHREVMELLAATPPTTGDALERVLGSEPEHGGWVDETIGPYKILEVLGEGGMGTVYLAEQREPVRRRVALKVIKLGMDTKAVLARFEAERQALALMNHPNIAKVLDVGATREGRPFFAMEHVPGVPIKDYCDRQRLNVKARIALLQQVCLGLQHAHQKGVVHRDIKPSNVLVQNLDHKPVPKIIDFGIAKATDHRLTEQTLYTEQGQIIGTPEYMSPEQAEMTGLNVDTRTDIYSLGVLLYELLTGALPFDSQQLRQAGFLEMRRKIREDEPPKPSTRVPTRREDTEALAKYLGADASGLVRALRGDLDWITMKALEKDPNRRYQSASELAADLQRHLEHEPVEASPPSTAYRLKKFLRKRRGPVAAGAAVFLALIGGLAGTWWQYGAAKSNLVLAKVNEAKATANLADYRRMKDAPFVDDLLEEAEEDLWPAHPDKVEAMDAWLQRADKLMQGEAGHRRKLEELRRKAEPASLEVQSKIEELDKHLAKREKKRGRLEKAKSHRRANRLVPKMTAELKELERQIAELEVGLRDKRWRFEDYQDRFLHGVFADLVGKLGQLTGDDGLIARIRARRDRAASLAVRSLVDRKEDWQRTVTAIAESAKYRGMPALAPQLGLVPLGPDAESALQEFALLDTGTVPERDATGNLQLNVESAVVLVLIPPGTFWMGAQKEDEQRPSHDPMATGDESPVREVRLDAFFLSKYEMTQGQWLRLMRTNPSNYPPHPRWNGTLQNPVEQVSWHDCMEVMHRLGLVLPTEAQWEYGARAGTTTPWWTGNEKSSLQGAANLADNYCKEHGGQRVWTYDIDLDDGHVVHAAVGSFRANGFGLHDVVGNVQEWCRDAYGRDGQVPRLGDGERVYASGRVQRGGSFSARLRVVRGGGFANVARISRSAYRSRAPSDGRYYYLGCRPAMRVISRR